MSILQNEETIKCAIAGSSVLIIDKFYFKSTSLKNSLILAGSVGGASYLANIIMKSNMLPSLSGSIGTGSTGLYSTKTVESRIVEISLAVGSAYGINTIILKNQKSLSLMELALLFVIPSVVSEVSSDYLYNRPISYLV